MDFIQRVLDWASDASNSYTVRTIVALLAIPGALWGMYLFIRFLGGRDIGTAIDKANAKLDAMISITTTNNQMVSFRKDDVYKLIDISRNTKYEGECYKFSLFNVLGCAAGFLNDYGSDRDARDFMFPMREYFQISRADADKHAAPDYMSMSKEREAQADRYKAAVVQVVQNVLSDCVALELLYSVVLGAGGAMGAPKQEVHYFLTNLGRAVVKEIRTNLMRP